MGNILIAFFIASTIVHVFIEWHEMFLSMFWEIKCSIKMWMRPLRNDPWLLFITVHSNEHSEHFPTGLTKSVISLDFGRMLVRPNGKPLKRNRLVSVRRLHTV